MDKFFRVIAKCGHVGRNCYYEGKFYEIARDGKEAAAIVRLRGRVKHDRKDAILSVAEITVDEYKEGLKSKGSEPYFNCKNKQEQNMHWDEIAPHVKPEDEIGDNVYSDSERREKRRARIAFKRAKYIQNYCNCDYLSEIYAC